MPAARCRRAPSGWPGLHPARSGQRALARLPPRAARDHRGGPGHLLELAGADVPGRRAAVAGQLPGAGPGRLRGDGAGRGECVGEFHYLHHGPGGAPYPDPNEMGRALLQAAAGRPADHPAGHLLPDRRAGPGRHGPGRCPPCSSGSATGTPPVGGPAGRARAGRARDARAARPGRGGHPLGPRGPPDQMHPVVEWSHHLGAPLHAHLSEQPAENEACLAAYGATPARVLDGAGALGPRSTMVHATH